MFLSNKKQRGYSWLSGHTWVQPIAPGHVEKVHEGVVLGVAVSLTDPDADAVVLPQALLALHHPHLFPQGVPGHLVDALLLEVVAGPVAVDHELVGVEGGLGQTVSLLVLGVDVWEPQARVLLEPVGAHEGVPEGARELPAGLELVQVHELLAVRSGHLLNFIRFAFYQQGSLYQVRGGWLALLLSVRSGASVLA